MCRYARALDIRAVPLYYVRISEETIYKIELQTVLRQYEDVRKHADV